MAGKGRAEVCKAAPSFALDAVEFCGYRLGGGLHITDTCVQRRQLLLALRHRLDDGIYLRWPRGESRHQIVDLSSKPPCLSLHARHLCLRALRAFGQPAAENLEGVRNDLLGEHVAREVVDHCGVDGRDGAAKARRAHSIAARPMVLAQVDLDWRLSALAVVDRDRTTALTAARKT
ncbi:MAG TPA: hypothetical protein VGY54_25370 [Polyangiaceae bacterium]|nr:hypothetical protein [Polyangiaceae bacterium]